MLLNNWRATIKEKYFCANWRSLLISCISALSLVYLLIETFPGHYHAINPTLLDESWVYALNCIANSKYLFGKDVVFTYGPLAYLMTPRHLECNLEQGLIFMLVLHFCFAAILYFYLKATKDKMQFFLFVLCYAITYALALIDNFLHTWYEYFLLLTFLLLCYLPGKLNRPVFLVGILAGLFVPVLAMIKFSLACTCFIALVLTTISWKLEFGKRSLPSIMATYITLLVSLITVVILFFHSFNNFSLWLLGSWEIAKGYGESMGLPINSIAMQRGIFLLILTLIAIAILLWKRTQLGYLSLISLGGLLISFKHSFIRQQVPFFLLYLGLISIVGLACRESRTAYKCFCWFAIVYILSLYPLSYAGINLNDISGVLDTTQGQRNIRRLIHLAKTEEGLDSETEKNFGKVKLPESFLSYINNYKWPSVLTLPDCFGYAPANNLNWHPLPVIQLYCAYTPYLDKLCADHLGSAKAPQFIIWGVTSDLKYGSGEIDNRNPIFEAPLTMLTLFRNYKLVKVSQEKDLLLLERRKEIRTISTEILKSEHCKMHDWVAVPSSEDLITAEIKFKPKPLPYSISKLYQLPGIDLKYGSPRWYAISRMIYPNFSSGLLLNCCPRNLSEFSKFFNKENPNPVPFIKIEGPGSKFFDSEFDIIWSKLKFGK